ncbi:FkbM family methyltransferase [Nocardioides sp.]|uniref:FkbM family methyltransferase n=1 Tax=Nocardioides sp. TaxID=35761 RepID=UPI0039E35D5E
MSEDFALTRAGKRIYVDPTDPRAGHLQAAQGDFNPGSLRLWERALGLWHWQVVVDVGVNYGEMLVGPELPRGARVIGFEPNLDLHPFLRRTLAEAGLDVEISDRAVADHAGSAVFAVDHDWSGTSSLLEVRSAGGHTTTVTVPVTTLDEALADAPGAVCVKVDVEGAEPAVLAGARALMTEREHWAIMLEVHHLPATTLATWADQQTVLLMDRRTSGLIKLPGRDPMLAADLLGASWLYPQDCLMVSPAIAEVAWEVAA